MDSIGPLLRQIDDVATTSTTGATSVSNRERIMQRVKKVVTMFAHKHQQNQNKHLSTKDSEAAVSGTPSGLFKVAMATQATAIPAKKQPTKLPPKVSPDPEAAGSPGTPPRSNLFKTVMAPVLPAKKIPVKKLPPVKLSPIKVKPKKESSSEES